MATKKKIAKVRNARGILINKWCGSCMYTQIESDGSRLCILKNRSVLCHSKCRKWELKEALLSAGNSGGKVKRLEYLMYVRDKRLEEQELIEQKIITSKQQMTCRQLRRRFNKEYGKGVYEIK